MREISTEDIEVGEHVLIDGEEYIAEEAVGETCDLCALHNHHCVLVPCDCDNVIFKKANEVNKEPTYRPYKDTDEMIADYKERFNISNVPDFCMPLIWVKHKNGALVYRRLISAFTDACVGFYDISMSVRELFDGYTYLDGSPCGKVEE